mmetsp:Transcript_20286/g.62502  ORF Transcript_20286/g.62502 Transcript_20286/m.62502 type:complete len:310 (-) Transcript_20286:128-1057(-)
MITVAPSAASFGSRVYVVAPAISVRQKPGEHALTRIRRGASPALNRVYAFSAHFDIPYIGVASTVPVAAASRESSVNSSRSAAVPGAASTAARVSDESLPCTRAPEFEDTCTTCAPSLTSGRNASVTDTTPSKLTRSVSSTTSASGVPSLSRSTPALFTMASSVTRGSSVCSFPLTSSTAAATDAGSVTSSCTGRTPETPFSDARDAASASPSARLRQPAKTRMPSFDSASTTARPMPLVPPVTSTDDGDVNAWNSAIAVAVRGSQRGLAFAVRGSQRGGVGAAARLRDRCGGSTARRRAQTAQKLGCS